MVEIKNRMLKDYLENVLGKKIENISYEELKTIKKYPFKCCSEEHDSDFDVLKYLTDGDSVFVENYELSQKDIDELFRTDCKSLTFRRCLIGKGLTIPKNAISEICFQGCLIEDYDSILTSNHSAKKIEFSNPYDEGEIDCNLIPESVETLVLNYCILNNCSHLGNKVNCTSLFVLGTDLGENLEFLQNMKNLKRVYLAERYLNDDNVKAISEHCDVKTDFIDLLFEKEEVKAPAK